MSQFLLHYRSSPSNALGGLTPAEVHLGRRIRTRMSLLMPQLNRSVESENSTMKETFDKHHGVKQRKYIVGDTIYAKVFDKNVWTWIPGKVIERQGKVIYVVSLTDGRKRVVHANQMKYRAEESGSVQEEEWNSTMLDIFELPVTLVDDSTVTTRSPSFSTPSTPIRTCPSTSVAVSQQQLPSVQRGPTPVSSSSATNGQGQQASTVAAPVLRRTTRQHKPVQRYDPSA